MKIYKRIISLLLTAVLLIPFFMLVSFAEGGTATVSVELLTIGSGYIVSPTKVEVTGTERASEVLMKLVAENGYVCYYGGEPESSYYLAYIADGNRSGRYNGYKCSSELYPVSSPKTLSISTRIPAATKSFLIKYADFFDENDYDESFRGYIGEFVYTNGSGWMCCLNGSYSQKDLAAIYLKPGDTLKLQFTLYLGVDLGAADSETQKLFNEAVSQTETTTAPPETTKAPEITTKAPETTTKAPEITTKAPETTTKAPEITTRAPEPTTLAPETTTEAPETTTFAPESAKTEENETLESTQVYDETSSKSETENSSPREEGSSENEPEIISEPQNGSSKIIIAVITAAAVVAMSAGAVIIIKNKKGEKHSEN